MPGNRVCLFMTQEGAVMWCWVQKHRFPLLDTRLFLFTARSPPVDSAGIAESIFELFPETTAAFLRGQSRGWTDSC